MRDHLLPAADLVLGAVCPGCGAPAFTVCRPCGRRILPAPRRVRDVRGVPVVAAGLHADVLRRVVVAWKEEAAWGLHGLLATLLAAAIADRAGAAPVVLVPVPATRRSRRSRGADVVLDLARTASRQLRAVGVDAAVRPVLTHTRTVADQAELDAPARAANLAGALRMHGAHRRAPHDVVVVDDVVTTGSTLGEAVRALHAGGWSPVAAAVVAATP